jgi:arylsulfatase
VIQKVEDLGKLDNTIIIYISGDNGASAEGSRNGTPFEGLPFNGVTLSAAQQMPLYDAWGTDKTYPHYAIGWAWAFDTPYKWTKQIPSFFGGTKNGMAISWPAKIKDKGGTRWQFHHVIDIVPTLLEVTGIPAPVMVDGVGQKPIEGVSLAYTFDKANANAPSTHRTQYFEMLSVQGLYNDGWMLSAVPIRAPWQLATASIEDPATAYKFELYDLSKDWTQSTDVAAANPKRVQQMRDLMFGEFAKYQVLPLDATASPRFVYPRPSLSAGRKVFTYSGSVDAAIPNGTQPNLLNTSYTITADIDVPEGDAAGMLVNLGGRYGGYGLYLLKGKPVFTYNLGGVARVRWEGPQALAPGKHTLVFDYKYDGLGFATLAFNNLSGIGRGGTGTLSVDGKAVATQKMARSTPLVYNLDDTFNIGTSSETPLDDRDYKVPFPFTGKLTKLTIAVDEPKLTPEDIKKLEEARRKQD